MAPSFSSTWRAWLIAVSATPLHCAPSSPCVQAMNEGAGHKLAPGLCGGRMPAPLPQPLEAPPNEDARAALVPSCAAQAAWNCSASVEPARATVSALGEIAEVTRSK
jgi:hypothetical protein